MKGVSFLDGVCQKVLVSSGKIWYRGFSKMKFLCFLVVFSPNDQEIMSEVSVSFSKIWDRGFSKMDFFLS